MRLENKRLFVPNLPDGITEQDVRKKFAKYGTITSIAIKVRSDLGPKHTSLQYAFVNIDSDHTALQACIHELSTKKWKGHFVDVQLAKESFLERLKKERQEQNDLNTSQISKKTKIVENVANEALDEQEKPNESNDCSLNSGEEDKTDFVIKNNKFKTHAKTIGSFGNAPTSQKRLKTKSLDPYRELADQKRLTSMKNMKKGYQQQKSTIKAALSNIDSSKSTKIVFDDNNEAIPIKQPKRPSSDKLSLFNEGDDNNDDDFCANFQVKQQFQGKRGKKLYELQTRFNNDKRFRMDERFLDDDDEKEEEENELDIQHESRQQLEILGEIIGKKFETKFDKPRKSMQRFDPTQPDHAKFELVEEGAAVVSKKSKKAAKITPVVEELPETSKETFYNIQDGFKDAFQQNETFSLLGTFAASKTDENSDESIKQQDNAVEIENKQLKKKKLVETRGSAFKYDSSDDEIESTKANKSTENAEASNNTQQNIQLGAGRLWTESFFFKSDDYRFQEGLDFVQKLQNDVPDAVDFAHTRHTLKVIVKKKVAKREGRKFKLKSKIAARKRQKRLKQQQ